MTEEEKIIEAIFSLTPAQIEKIVELKTMRVSVRVSHSNTDCKLEVCNRQHCELGQSNLYDFIEKIKKDTPIPFKEWLVNRYGRIPSEIL
jgi:hypothetical protein